MLGHRKLNVDDYLAILKRRRWLIAIPVLIFPIIAYAITYLIPAQYLSQTLVLIEEQKVSSEIAPSVMSSSLDNRLSSMREQILSRSRLEPLITKYNLYPSKRISPDDRVDMMRKAIAITPIRSAVPRTGGLPGFYISFMAADPRTAMLVCGEITTLFVNENLKAREDATEGTTEFLKSQLEAAKRDLDDKDAKLAAFQRQYVGKLPGQENTNTNMLTTLNTQLQASSQTLQRLEQDEDYEKTMLAQALQNMPVPTAGGPTAQAPQVQEAELQSLISQEAELSAHYTPDYPDVIAIRRKIADLRKKIAATPATPTVASAPQSAPSRYDPPAVQQLRAQIRSAELGIQAQKQQQGQIQRNLATYEERVAASPLVEEQYKELVRGNDTAQKFYDSLLSKMNMSEMSNALEHQQQGEQFRVMDEPNLPDSPTYPKRQLFAIAGFAVGLMIGLLLAAFLEYKDTALRTEQDVWAFTRLPTLAVIAYSGELEAHHMQKRGVFSRLKDSLSRKHPKEEDLTKVPV